MGWRKGAGRSLHPLHHFLRFLHCQAMLQTDLKQGRRVLKLWVMHVDLGVNSFDWEALNADLEYLGCVLCIQLGFGDVRDLWHCEQAFHMHKGVVLCRLELRG